MRATLLPPRPGLCAAIQHAQRGAAGCAGPGLEGGRGVLLLAAECGQEKVFFQSSFRREVMFEAVLLSARLDSELPQKVQVWARAGREGTLGRNLNLPRHHGSPPPAKKVDRWLLHGILDT